MKTSNPYSEDLELAGEYLRLAVSWLSTHKLPPTPVNYRLAYDSISGRGNELNKILEDEAAPAGPTLQEQLWYMHQQLHAPDTDALSEIRQEMMGLIKSMQDDLQVSGEKAGLYAERLNRFASILDHQPSGAEIATEVTAVRQDTLLIETDQRRLHSQLAMVTNEIDVLRRELAQIRDESCRDFLTGIGNRKSFDTALEETICSAREHKSTFSILLADVDHFKNINDTYGHLVGDKVLRFVASVLKRHVKGRDTVARYGGEEFAVILPDTEVGGAHAVAEQIRRGVSNGKIRHVSTEQILGNVTISVGVAQFEPTDLQNDLIQRADRALYQAKEGGRNRVAVLAAHAGFPKCI